MFVGHNNLDPLGVINGSSSFFNFLIFLTRKPFSAEH